MFIELVHKCRNLQFGFIFLLSQMFSCFSSDAAPNSQKKTPEAPIDISAAKGVRIFDEENYMEALNEVSISRGHSTIYGNHARINYLKEQNKRQIQEVIVSGDVVTVSPNITIYAEKGVYNLPREEVLYTGKQLKLYGKSGTIFAHKKLVYNPRLRLAKAIGQAEVQSHISPHKLFGEEIRVYFKEHTPPSLKKHPAPTLEKREAVVSSTSTDSPYLGENSVDHLEADGAVRLVLPGKIATGDHAFYRADGNIIELWGRVSVIDEKKHLKGAYAIVYKDKGQSEVYAELPQRLKKKGVPALTPGRVKIMLLPG